MTGDIIIGLIVVGITLGLVLLRTHAALVFFVLLAGTVLSSTFYRDTLSVASGVVAPTTTLSVAIRLALIFLPAIVIAVAYRKSAGRMLAMHIVPALLTALASFFLIYDLAPSNLQLTLLSSKLYPFIAPYRQLFLAAGFVSATLVFMLTYRPSKGEHGSKHKEH